MGETDKTTVQTEQDEFATIFSDLTAGLKEPGAAAQTAEQKAAADKAAADAAAAAEAAKTPEQKAADVAAADKAAADAAAAVEAAKTPEQKAADVAAAAAAAKEAEAKAAADKAAADAAAAAAAEAATTSPLIAAAEKLTAAAEALKPPAKDEKTGEASIYSPEEEELLKKYAAEWDIVAKGEALIRRSEYRALVQHVFAEVQKAYSPILQYIEDRSPRDQLADVTALVPDYRDVRDPCVAWAQQQPKLMKDTYARVIESGTPEEVRDLISIWKTATNYQPKTAATAAATTVAPVIAAVVPDAKTAAAIAALKPADSARTTPTTAADPSDFEGAFAEFASKAA